MVKKLLLFAFCINCTFLSAQSLKTDVLVIGGSASGVAAAIQSARSKVKTILAYNGVQLSGGSLADQMITIEMNRDIPSGIWGEFRKHIRDSYRGTAGYDTAQKAALKFDPGMGTSILKKMMDTVKNLTQHTDTKCVSIKKDGEGWDVRFTQNEKTLNVRAKVVIDATEDGGVVIKAGARFNSILDEKEASGNQYRTSIACWGAMPGYMVKDTSQNINKLYPASFIPLNSILIKNADNLLITEKALPGEHNFAGLPLQLQIGQGAGATAAFCAFFKTTTRHLHVRIIQGEILDFKGFLLPFTDIIQNDPAWRAVQQIGSTGLLVGKWHVNKDGYASYVFNPDAPVYTAEVQPGLTEIYTRAFLWFNKEKPGEKFTVGNLLSLISDYTLTEQQVLIRSVKNAWKPQFKLQTDFDLTRPVSRREFAVLANKYLNPFARTVDLTGRLIN